MKHSTNTLSYFSCKFPIWSLVYHYFKNYFQDLHLVNMEDFRYGGTNITAFRLVDPNNPLVQEVVRWVPTSLPSAWWILTTLYCSTGGCKVGTNITAFRLGS